MNVPGSADKTFEQDLDGDQERKLGRSIMFAFDDDASGLLDVGEFDSAFDWAVEGMQCCTQDEKSHNDNNGWLDADGARDFLFPIRCLQLGRQ